MLPKKNFSQGKSLHKAPLRKTSLKEEQKSSLEVTAHYSFSSSCFKGLRVRTKLAKSEEEEKLNIFLFYNVNVAF